MRRLLFLLALPFLANCDGAIPIPENFKAAFTSGRVCVPKQLGNATAAATYPVRFEFCRYRCINITQQQLRLAWQCQGPACQMMMLAMGDAHRVDTEVGCDARDLESPPADECTMESYPFTVTVPDSQGTPITGAFQVQIPYLTLEQADKVMARLDAGESPPLVFQEEIGVQNYPNRQFTLQFAPTSPNPSDATEADCTPIGLP